MGARDDEATLLVLPRLEAGSALDLAEQERATGIVGWPTFTQQRGRCTNRPDVNSTLY
jgi:hypothetical protein